ncbi:hypothetical protein L5M28_07410 [Shewanella sp. SW32]|uniref:hypothetical protein n=1 Tax=unclassified Shewanella TaxID=196818 RepID=UPI0021DB22FB|nr:MULTISPECIES: hypothetical protein [unclassified Shewanella]MCU7962405.1 hypothetical protein [Shewanella sp. SW32]MCU7969253.1 hypothetical protein [Shewanella sp. SW29]
MTNEEWFELFDARLNEIKSAISGLNLADFTTAQCDAAAREIIGIHLDANGFNMITVASCMYGRLCRGTMALDEAVTLLNNLPLGLHIADMQRAEVYSEEPELQLSLEGDSTKSLEQLCDEYEESVCTGKQSIEAQAYIMALEDLVSEMQGKSFADSSRIGQLEAENAVLKYRPSTAEYIQLGNDMDALYGFKR